MVAANLERDASYRFILPQGRSWDTTVEDCRQLLARQIGGDRVRENCAFRLTAAPLYTGIVLYQLDTARLEAEEPALYAQICDYLAALSGRTMISNSDILMDPEYLRQARKAFNLMWSSSIAV